MTITIHNALEREVSKRIRKHQGRLQAAARERSYFTARTGLRAERRERVDPRHWLLAPGFHPYRTRQHLPLVSHALGPKVEAGLYTPGPTLMWSRPKPGGKVRRVGEMLIPDAAVAYHLYRCFSETFEPMLHPNAFAFRKTLTRHDATRHIAGCLRAVRNGHVVELDFENFYDGIDHSYVLRMLRDVLGVTGPELRLVEAFLRAPRADNEQAYKRGDFLIPERGLLQGSSLSLFLSNVSCLELDRELEQAGVRFARYADDLVAVCVEEVTARRCIELVEQHGVRSGVKINHQKSPGISRFRSGRAG